MLVHAKLTFSETNGPGRRAVIWTKGCLLKCRGCFNPETWNVGLLGEPMPVMTWETATYLAKWIIMARDSCGVTGLTFSGGEPMHQVYPLIDLCQEITSQWPECSIGMFTGYTPAELDEGRYQIFRVDVFYHSQGAASVMGVSLADIGSEERKKRWDKLKTYLDFAIMGRYVASKKCKHPYLGSSNQEIVLLSPRYKLEDFGTSQQMEIIVEPDGLVQITGFSDLDLSREI